MYSISPNATKLFTGSGASKGKLVLPYYGLPDLNWAFVSLTGLILGRIFVEYPTERNDALNFIAKFTENYFPLIFCLKFL